ncbi:hypothetical protein EYF80_003305 [Liparis tanakae]|uniref:Uncharacterized protein n=1 Tax=Liparis tanakae TaxID=230148 RepID=A0A4Z2J845_9TELE|nr:hypothetical protein EYF80_003305 [Liparis tanakae]
MEREGLELFHLLRFCLHGSVVLRDTIATASVRLAFLWLLAPPARALSCQLKARFVSRLRLPGVPQLIELGQNSVAELRHIELDIDAQPKVQPRYGWVSPRRGQGPGTQSILQRGDFQAEGLEPSKVLLSAEANSLEKKKKKTTPFTIPKPPSICGLQGKGKAVHMAIAMMKFPISLVCGLAITAPSEAEPVLHMDLRSALRGEPRHADEPT